jgi:hypothetical protein
MQHEVLSSLAQPPPAQHVAQGALLKNSQPIMLQADPVTASVLASRA